MDALDRDYAIRTLFGEAATDPASQAAVAHVIRQRALKSGKSVREVVLAPKQFEPWETRRPELEGLDPKSEIYQGLGNVVDAVWSGNEPDPTGGATLFYSPTAQSKLGRKPPEWDTGKGVDIGLHRFFGGAFHTPVENITTGLGSTPTLPKGVSLTVPQIIEKATEKKKTLPFQVNLTPPEDTGGTAFAMAELAKTLKAAGMGDEQIIQMISSMRGG
jgi:hypothetical protein